VTAYRYRPGRHNSRRRGGNAEKIIGVALAAAVIASLGSRHHAAASTAAALTTRQAPDRAAATAVAYARRQIGRPYVWGGTGPGGFDCSGLAMEAWAAAGVQVERTSEQQWASERRVAIPRPGDLVFFAGGDGTPTAPGHVGIVIDPARHLMVDAYTTGWGVVVQTYGLSSSPGGDSPVIGYTDPAAS
jgi:cell wall-associated NlpC family hydrolase